MIKRVFSIVYLCLFVKRTCPCLLFYSSLVFTCLIHWDCECQQFKVVWRELFFVGGGGGGLSFLPALSDKYQNVAFLILISSIIQRWIQYAIDFLLFLSKITGAIPSPLRANYEQPCLCYRINLFHLGDRWVTPILWSLTLLQTWRGMHLICLLAN